MSNLSGAALARLKRLGISIPEHRIETGDKEELIDWVRRLAEKRIPHAASARRAQYARQTRQMPPKLVPTDKEELTNWVHRLAQREAQRQTATEQPPHGVWLPGEGPIDEEGRGLIVDELDSKVLIRARKVALERMHRAVVSSAREAILGSTQQVFGGGPLQTCVYYDGDTDESIPITINTIPPPTTLTIPVRPFCRMRFGTRSFPVIVDVDITLGSQFTIMGSLVSATVGADPVGSLSAQPLFRVGAMAAFGVWSGTSPIFRTHFYDALGPGASKNQLIPTFSVSLYSVQRSDSSVALDIKFLDASGTVLYDFALASNSFFNFPIPIADDVQSITVTNNDGAKTVNVRAMFQLAL